HRRADHPAVGARAVAQRIDDLPDAPIADPGFPIGRDVRADYMPGLDIELAPAGQFHARDRGIGGVARRMAIAADRDGIDQIGAALAIGLRRAATGTGREQDAGAQARDESRPAAMPDHRVPTGFRPAWGYA